MIVSDIDNNVIRVFAMAEEVIVMKKKISEFEATITDFINENSGCGGGYTGPDLTDLIEKIKLNGENIIIGESSAPDLNNMHKPTNNKQNIILEDSRVFIGKNEANFMYANQYDKPNSVVIGNNVAVNGKNGIAIGTNVIASDTSGSDSTVYASVAIGNDVRTSKNGIAIGSDLRADENEVKIGKYVHKHLYLGNLSLIGDFGDSQAGRLPGLQIFEVTSSTGSSNVACKKIDVGTSSSLIFPRDGKFRIVSGTKSILIDLTTDNQIIFRNESTSKQASLNLV
jgi:hypothetical protein